LTTATQIYLAEYRKSFQFIYLQTTATQIYLAEYRKSFQFIYLQTTATQITINIFTNDRDSDFNSYIYI